MMGSGEACSVLVPPGEDHGGEQKAGEEPSGVVQVSQLQEEYLSEAHQVRLAERLGAASVLPEQSPTAPSSDRGSGRQVVRRRRYLTPAAVKELPEPSWLLERLIPSGSLVVLYGPPKVGKSFLALDWALSMAEGCDWLGRATSSEPQPVVYLAGEGIGGLGKRLKAWEQHYGRQTDELPIVFPNLVVNLFEANAVTQFLQELQKCQNAHSALIIVDTLSKAMIGADENSARDVNRGLASADAIRRETGGTVLLIHHTTKSDARVERGSTALRGAADVMLRLEAKGDETLSLVVDSARDFEPGLRVHLRFKPEGDSGILVEATGYVSESLSPRQQNALETLVTVNEGGEVASGKWRDTGGIDKRRFYEVANALRERGYVEKRCEGRNVYYSLTQKGSEALAAEE